MKLKKRKTILASTIILSLNVSANDFYIVKKGDTLSSILLSKHMKPIYGKRGTLAETLKLNPKISLSGGNKIFPFMKIVLVTPKLATKIITADSRQQTADSRQQTADSRQQTADSRQQTAEYSIHQPRDSLRRS